MVTVHNTQNYHNYIYNFNNNEFSINPNTLLEYISQNHNDIYKQYISTNNRLKSLLNKNGLKQTLFISANNSVYDIYEYLFEGIIEVNDSEYFILNKNNHAYRLSKNKLNDHDIVVSNIKLENGIIHIIN